MSLEKVPIYEVPHESLDVLKETYKRKMETILNKQLTVENIEIFADEALSETMQLTDDILFQYRNNPEFKGDNTLNSRTQEDVAFKILELPDIQEILQSIINIKEKIATLKIYIDTNTKNLNEIITPPQPDRQTEIISGSGEGIEKKIFPRFLTLMYILEHDFDIQPNEVLMTRGVVTTNMMRKTPYVRVEIPELNRVVYICDEEGNVSYIFDTTKLNEKNLTLEEIDLDDKGDKNSLIAHYPGIGVRFVQSSLWRENVEEYLGQSIPEIQTDREKQKGNRMSEFGIEKKEFLPFEDFKREVRELYPGKGDIQKWYHEERRNHPNWPSQPHEVYKDKGWISWPELVGIEKKEFLPFEDFKREVRELYPGKGDIKKWYHEERRNHPNWPSNPDRVYKDKGWISWSELVGIEKKELLPFEDFKREVRELYPGKGDIKKWYHEEKRNHPNWPSAPDKVYKDKGWISWSELVGIEKRFNKK